MASNRLLIREFDAEHTEPLHLFCEVQDGDSLYLIAAERKEARRLDWYHARQRNGRWHWRKCSDSSNPRIRHSLQALIDAFNQGQNVFNGSQYVIENSHVRYIGQRAEPIRGQEDTFSYTLLAAWLAMELISLWYFSTYLDLPEWCMTYLPFLTRRLAPYFSAFVNVFVSFALFRAMEPSLYSALCSVTAPPALMLAIPLIRLYPVLGPVILLSAVVFAFFRIRPAVLRIRTARTAGSRRESEQLALERLGDVLWVVAIASSLLIVRSGSPPLVLTSQTAVASEDEVSRTAEDAWRSYQPTLEALSPEHWAALDLQGRVDVLQQIVNYEATQTLGCGSAPVQVVVSGNATTLGSYSESQHSISIDEEHILQGDEAEVIDTALHELRHHYQKQIIGCMREIQTEHPEYMRYSYFEDANKLLENENNYISSDTDPTAYYHQPLEEDARDFARQRMAALYLPWIQPENAA